MPKQVTVSARVMLPTLPVLVREGVGVQLSIYSDAALREVAAGRVDVREIARAILGERARKQRRASR